MHELKQIATQKFNADGSYAEVLEAVISFLQDDKTPTIATSVESFGSTFQWFTTEIERLRQEISLLTSERDQARAKLQQLQYQPQDQGELKDLKAENERLKAEVTQFQQIKQMLGGTIAEPALPAVAPIASPPPTAPSPQWAPQPKTTLPTTQKRISNDD